MFYGLASSAFAFLKPHSQRPVDPCTPGPASFVSLPDSKPACSILLEQTDEEAPKTKFGNGSILKPPRRALLPLRAFRAITEHRQIPAGLGNDGLLGSSTSRTSICAAIDNWNVFGLDDECLISRHLTSFRQRQHILSRAAEREIFIPHNRQNFNQLAFFDGCEQPSRIM